MLQKSVEHCELTSINQFQRQRINKSKKQIKKGRKKKTKEEGTRQNIEMKSKQI